MSDAGAADDGRRRCRPGAPERARAALSSIPAARCERSEDGASPSGAPAADDASERWMAACKLKVSKVMGAAGPGWHPARREGVTDPGGADDSRQKGHLHTPPHPASSTPTVRPMVRPTKPWISARALHVDRRRGPRHVPVRAEPMAGRPHLRVGGVRAPASSAQARPDRVR